MLTVITPTTGRGGLDRLINSMASQTVDCGIIHILLWDNVRSEGAKNPDFYRSKYRHSLVMPDGFGKHGHAPGSRLRALGLILATTQWVMFADDDVWWEPSLIELTIGQTSTCDWITVHRRIWSSATEIIGVDRFESVGDSPDRRVPYEMCDGNTMIFKRRWGVLAAPLFRETQNYNDDRIMYSFLKKNSGPRLCRAEALINQICPPKLKNFFLKNCSTQ